MCVFKSCNDRRIAVFSECPTGMWNINLINNLNQKFLFLPFPPPQSMAKFSCWRQTCERHLSLLSVSPQQLPSSVGFHCYCPHLSHLPLPRHKSLGSAHRDHRRVCTEPSLTTRLTQRPTHITHTMTDRQTPGSNIQRVAPRQFSTSRCICQIIASPSRCTCGPSLLRLFSEREGPSRVVNHPHLCSTLDAALVCQCISFHTNFSPTFPHPNISSYSGAFHLYAAAYCDLCLGCTFCLLWDDVSCWCPDCFSTSELWVVLPHWLLA